MHILSIYIMYHVLQVKTSFSFFDNFLSRSIKVGQSSSRRRRLQVAATLRRRRGDVVATFPQSFGLEQVSETSRRRRWDVAETSSSSKTYLVAATSPRRLRDQLETWKSLQRVAEKIEHVWFHRDSLATRQISMIRRGDVSTTHGDSSRQQVAN